eukprot:jgi/Tetstr1/430138/TSEL_019971.t1
MAQDPSDFRFCLSSDINFEVAVKMGSLVGALPYFKDRRHTDDWSDYRPYSLFVAVSLCNKGELLSIENRTKFTQVNVNPDSGRPAAVWDEWIAFSVKIRDLLPTAQLSATVWHFSEGQAPAPLGGATMCLFSKKGRLKTGRHTLRLWSGRVADTGYPSSTPGKEPVAGRGQIGRLQELCKRYDRGELAQIDWLDRLTFKEVDRCIHHGQASQQDGAQGGRYLTVELPTFPQAAFSGGLGSADAWVPGGHTVGALHDPEVGRDNPTELKAQKLARSLTRGVIDRDLKPDTEERRQIAAILKQPPNRPLTVEQKGLLWRFRFSLTTERSALTRFLKSVDWSDAQEAKQAAELMQKWAPIDIADALELLSPDFVNEEVRRHAVEVLQRAEDDELCYYLLQLVQALRYEAADESKLAQFLIKRAIRNPVLGMHLHWYLFTEWEDQNFGPRASKVHEAFVQALISEPQGYTMWDGIRHQIEMIAQLAHIIRELKTVRGGAAKKAERLQEMVSESGSCGELSHATMPNPLDPLTLLAGMIPTQCTVFKSAMSPLRLTFKTVPAGPAMDNVDGGGHGAAHGVASGSASGSVANPGGTSNQHAPHSRDSNPPGPHADSPDPARRLVLIYKRGDDLRQDQLVVQIVSLMDRLLKKENLDLKLTLYQVLPTSSEDGLVECVQDATVLARVLADHRTINRFLALHSPQPDGPFGLDPRVLDAFVKSCAGYCVITYILGVGDRHLDNLMLCKDGRLFHIDFGFIMGRDPKPFPPPMKLCREMVEAMGGAESEHYVKFRTYCCEAYNILRKSANLILSLFHLMAGADLPDIKDDPEKVMLKLQEKLRLDLDDDAAVQWIQQLINESASALMPAIMETTHRWAQYWR